MNRSLVVEACRDQSSQGTTHMVLNIGTGEALARPRTLAENSSEKITLGDFSVRFYRFLFCVGLGADITCGRHEEKGSWKRCLDQARPLQLLCRKDSKH